MAERNYKKVVLVVLDGFGVASYSHGNAIALAQPEAIDNMISHYPALSLQASGPLVGLPWGEVGNSEVGHLNLGAGRIVGQDLPRINSAISDHSFFTNPVLVAATQHAKNFDSQLHIIGLASDGGVHSSIEHLYALLGLAQEQGLSKVFIHLFTDGRDTGEKVALDSMAKLQSKISSIGVGKVATLAGRFYGMDRGGHWDQTIASYKAMVDGEGDHAESLDYAILDSYDQGVYDEMIKPTVIIEKDADGKGAPVGSIKENDAVIFFNFRSDRALQLTRAFVEPDEIGEEVTHAKIPNLFFVTMTEYFYGLPVHVAFPTVDLGNNLAEILSKNGKTQFHIAESEKYAHVTSFFNGGVSSAFPGEERKIVTSPDNNRHYDRHPEMSGEELSEFLVEKITKEHYDFYLANFANPDMVGHTGNLDAAIKAVHFIDRFLQKIMTAVFEVDGVLLITADHGNIEKMIDSKTGSIDKEHTTSPVPLIMIAQDLSYKTATQKNYLTLAGQTPSGVISDVAPTVLELMGIDQPNEMRGVSLMPQIEDLLD